MITSEEFIEANERLVWNADEKDPSILAILFRNIHTIKGNARTYGFLNLTDQVHETENEYDQLRKGEELEWDQTHLLQQLHETYELIEEYAQINDLKLGRKGPGRRGEVERYLMVEKTTIAETVKELEKVDSNNSEAVMEALNHTLLSLKLIGTDSLENILSGIKTSLPSLAEALNKETPRVRIEDNHIFISNQVISLLRNAFMHIFRNSIDHGLETAEERESKGKYPVGHIHIKMKLDDNQLTFRYKDDGRGLALQKIRQKAIEQNIISEQDALSPKEIGHLIFHSGFSTAETITDVSGRGVGMDAVRSSFREEQGNVEIQFLEDPQPDTEFVSVEFVFTLPPTLGVQAS